MYPKNIRPAGTLDPSGQVILLVCLLFVVEPSAPCDLKVNSANQNSLEISWSASVSDGGAPIQQYIVVMREASKKKFKKVGKVDGQMLSYSITSGLEQDKEYYIRVYAENTQGISQSAAEIDSPVKIPAAEIQVRFGGWIYSD